MNLRPSPNATGGRENAPLAYVVRTPYGTFRVPVGGDRRSDRESRRLAAEIRAAMGGGFVSRESHTGRGANNAGSRSE